MTEESKTSDDVPSDNKRVSSPLPNREQGDLSFSVSSLTTREISQKEDISEDRNLTLFSDSEKKVADASTLVELFCSRFSLSDEASNNLYSIVKEILPVENTFPSGYAFLQGVKRNFNSNVRSFKTSSDRKICVLHFKFQLRDILLINFTHILNISDYKRRNNGTDFKTDFLSPVTIKNNSLIINLTIFTDGVNIKKSTIKKELWPVWLQIADLPPKLRMAQKNVVLAALYIGSKVPDWNEVVPEIRAELLTSCTLNISSNLSFEVTFKVKLMVCDLDAKSHVPNMLKFNGFFGCHYCTVEGKTIGRTHSHYPFEEMGQIREPTVNDPFIIFAEKLTSETKKCCWRKRKECVCMLD